MTSADVRLYAKILSVHMSICVCVCVCLFAKQVLIEISCNMLHSMYLCFA